MSEPELHNIPVARYAFTIKERAGGEPWILLDPLDSELRVLADGLFGIDFARPERARELARRLDALVRLVGYERPDTPSPHQGPWPRGQRARYAFVPVRGCQAGDQWVEACPGPDGGLPVLAGGSISFLLEPSASADDAAELAWDLWDAGARLTYTDMLDTPIHDSRMPPGSLG